MIGNLAAMETLPAGANKTIALSRITDVSNSVTNFIFNTPVVQGEFWRFQYNRMLMVSMVPLIAAYRYTSNPIYIKGIVSQLEWFTGRTPMGASVINGVGDRNFRGMLLNDANEGLGVTPVGLAPYTFDTNVYYYSQGICQTGYTSGEFILESDYSTDPNALYTTCALWAILSEPHWLTRPIFLRTQNQSDEVGMMEFESWDTGPIPTQMIAYALQAYDGNTTTSLQPPQYQMHITPRQ